MPKAIPKTSRLRSKKPEDAAWRYRQAQIDADIEGLARDPDAERLVAQMTAEGLSSELKIERIKAYFAARKGGKPEVG